MTTKLSGRLPDTEESGMDKIQGALVKHPERRHVVLTIMDCVSTKVDHTRDGDIFTPTAGIVFAEPLRDQDDINAVLEIMGRVRAERLEDGTLDFDFGLADDPSDAAANSFLRNATGVFAGGAE
jgi:hypothetical protein